jgi:hypothetical protein
MDGVDIETGEVIPLHRPHFRPRAGRRHDDGPIPEADARARTSERMAIFRAIVFGGGAVAIFLLALFMFLPACQAAAQGRFPG